jgi:hypothetical protein
MTMIKEVARPSDETLRSFWPDDSDRPPRKRPEGPIKTDEQREADARAKLSNPLHPTTSMSAGDARYRFPNGERWPAKYKLVGPKPQEDGTNPVVFHGGASRSVPTSWGPGYTSRFGREYLAERVTKDGKSIEQKTLAKPVMRYARLDPTGDSARMVPCTEKQAEVSFHVGWKGGAERISTKQGDRIVYNASDKLPCRGSGEMVTIVRDTEERTGKKGAFTVETFRATCPGCKQVRNVPHKVAKADPRPSTWVFPDHASPNVAKASGYQDSGGIVVLQQERRDKTGDRIVATVSHVDPDEQSAWQSAPDYPEQFYGPAVSLAMGAALVGDRSVKSVKSQHDGALMRAVEGANFVRGLHRACELYRTCKIVGSVAHVESPRATRAASPAKSPAPSFGRTVRELVGISDTEFAAQRKAAKREAHRPILCDAFKAPIRQILAF